jgi:Putative adhesin
MTLRVSRKIGAVLLPSALLFGACDMSLGNLMGRATEEWTHTYPLTAGGEVRIVNTNGKVDVEGVDGNTVEVRAEKIAKGATEDAAREMLPRIKITEDVKPDRVSVETERMGGIMIGAGFEVRYHVKAPKDAVITVVNTNGVIALTSLAGKVSAHTTNGMVSGKRMTGGVDAHTTNGGVNIDMASVGTQRIALHTTNGGVTLSLPDTAKATLDASCTNGGINVSSLDKLDITDKSRRHIEGKLNGGGTSITLETTNGGIRVRARDGNPAPSDTDDDDKPEKPEKPAKPEKAPKPTRS